MARKSSPAKPVVETINLRGKMGREIAGMILGGEISQADAEAFVADRAVRKLHQAIEKVQA